MDDKLTFLDGDSPAEAAPAPAQQEPVAEALAVETADRARSPDGRFAPKEADAPAPVAQAAPEASQVPAAPAQAAPQPGASEPPKEPERPPLAALLDERGRRKAAEERAKALDDELKRLQAERQLAPQAPDRYQDPEAYEAFQRNEIAQQLYNERLNFSERFARKEHGSELVDQAQTWAVQRQAADPAFAQRIQGHADPYDYVVAEFKRDQMYSKLDPSDWDQFQQWKAAQTGSQGALQASAPAATSHPAAPTPPAPPRSIVSQPSAGSSKPGGQPVGPGVAFNAVFK